MRLQNIFMNAAKRTTGLVVAGSAATAGVAGGLGTFFAGVDLCQTFAMAGGSTGLSITGAGVAAIAGCGIAALGFAAGNKALHAFTPSKS